MGNKIENIKNFMLRVTSGIDNPPDNTENDKNKKKFIGLLEIIRDMGCLNKKIQEIVPSIKGELEVLKKHSQSTSEDDLLTTKIKKLHQKSKYCLMKSKIFQKVSSV